MPNNFLLTGAPGTGKTTVIETVVDRLEDREFAAGGIYCPEIRAESDRVGFEIVDILSGDSRVLAHVNLESGPSVGKYRVNVDNIDAICSIAFEEAYSSADFLVVDEIAPMEIHSEEFVRQVRRALDSTKPLLAVIHRRSTSGFVGEVKMRDDIDIFEVTTENRGELPTTLTESLLSLLDC